MLVNIECPACQQDTIKIEPHMLAQGASFSCATCLVKISVAQSSKSEIVKGVDAYDAYKNRLAELQEQGNAPELL